MEHDYRRRDNQASEAEQAGTNALKDGTERRITERRISAPYYRSSEVGTNTYPPHSLYETQGRQQITAAQELLAIQREIDTLKQRQRELQTQLRDDELEQHESVQRSPAVDELTAQFKEKGVTFSVCINPSTLPPGDYATPGEVEKSGLTSYSKSRITALMRDATIPSYRIPGTKVLVTNAEGLRKLVEHETERLTADHPGRGLRPRPRE